MKTKRLHLFRRIITLIFVLISGLSFLCIAITYFATTHFYLAGTQLLNKDVAAHIAKFTSPFENGGINSRLADSVFYNAMVISPTVEVYFLDTTGKVIAYHASKNDIKRWHIPLDNIRRHIASNGTDYIKGPDPRDPSNSKIFSAAEVLNGKTKLGYIYVILGSNEYRNVSEMLFRSHISKLALEAFCITIGLSVVISLLYIKRLQRGFNNMVGVLERFQAGDFDARFGTTENSELAPVTQSFNKMADLLVYNINRLKKSEKERKDFIANISHDLRTPLSIARGYSETVLLRKGSEEWSREETQRYVQMILNKILQVENMVLQLFELSKMESVDFRPHMEPFIFSEILLEVIDSSAATATGRKVKIDCIGCQNNSWVCADIAMMERVIQNLIVNAIKYTPQNGEIRTTLQQQDDELIVNIENTGLPFPEGLLNWINNMNDEYSFAESRPAESGLGLVIVKKILHLHMYSLEAKTNTGLGNRLSIRIPVYSAN